MFWESMRESILWFLLKVRPRIFSVHFSGIPCRSLQNVLINQVHNQTQCHDCIFVVHRMSSAGIRWDEMYLWNLHYETWRYTISCWKHYVMSQQTHSSWVCFQQIWHGMGQYIACCITSTQSQMSKWKDWVVAHHSQFLKKVKFFWEIWAEKYKTIKHHNRCIVLRFEHNFHLQCLF